MRAFDRDLIRGGHYGQRSCEPHQQAEHMAAPTNAAFVRKTLPTRSRPHMAHSGRDDLQAPCPLSGQEQTSALSLSARLELARSAPRCGAHSKRTGRSCKAPAMPNGRCRMHGGKSTGPRTPEGLARSRKANWKHGGYSAEAIADRRKTAEALRLLRRLVAAF